MNTNEWVAVISCGIGLIAAIYSVIKVVTKSIMQELLPNSGKSMRDSIESTKNEIQVLSKRTDEIFKILADWHTR